MASVLIVDDDPFVRKLLLTTLEDVAEFELMEAADGLEAVELAARCRPELVFLDIDMPRLDGIEACRQLRAQPGTAQATIVMLTADSGDSAAREAETAGADLFLSKPFSPLALLRLLDELGRPARPAGPSSATEVRAHLGLGSNQGDRVGALREARNALERHGVRVAAASSVYETAAQGELPDQPDFLNVCLAVDVRLGAEELLEVCKAVERELGREPGGPRHGPRPIDVDVLLAGTLEHHSDRLTLPHPELTRRRFVLEPLLELDPGLTLPDGTPLAGRLDLVGDQRVERVGSL